MSNQWLRLWHDMPTDPKFRVVAKASKQPLHLVIAVYVTLLVDASKNSMSRGVTQCHDEDLAVTVDCDIEQIQAIKAAMQGRLLDGDVLSGWEKRQPKREDSGDENTGAKSHSQRKKAQRERENAAAEFSVVTPCHAVSRNVTTDKDKDTDKDTGDKSPLSPELATITPSEIPHCPHAELLDLFAQHLPQLPQPKPELWTGARADALKSRWRWVLTAKKRNGERYATNRAEGLDWFGRFFEYVSGSDFLTGRSSDWQCDLGWLVKADNFAKVVQGNYENKAVAA